MADLNEREDATPESAGITGGVPAAAEPPPQTRGRLGSEHASTYIFVILAILLLLTAAIADQDSSDAIGMVILGVALIAIAVMSITAFLGPVAVALLGFAAGVLSTVLAFSTDDFGAPQLVLLVCGAATFIASFASLAATERPGSGDSEPSAGVENV